MSPTRTCPRCQTSFSADIIDAQVGGVCPRCLFQLVMGEAGEVTVKAPSSGAAAGGDSDLPKHLGNYEILGMVGAGGMGKVYKAKQRGLDRFVAIKVLGGGGQEEIERFFREARASAKLHHPNIIPIHEVVSEGGRYFYAMDFVEGKTLERAVKDGGLPLRQGLEILAKTARAIHFAHENGVVHRDIKPANILLDARGEPMVADFGLAKDISSEAGLTQSGYLLGTPSFMAPEQAEPDRKGEVDARSDVYSLGATLYHVLTGRPPHEGRSVYEVIAKVVGTDPASPRSSKPEIPRDVETICLKALRRDRASRYASAKELAEDLDRFLAGDPILARPVGFVESLVLKARRHRRPIAIGALVAGFLLAAAILILRARPARVDLVTDPPGAVVFANGVRLEGKTPLEGRRFSSGSVEFRFTHEGYREARRAVTLTAGGTQEVRLPLVRLTGRLTLTSVPDGAVAHLTAADGARIEAACPVRSMEIPAGEYRMRLEKSQHFEVAEPIRIDADQETRASRVLPPRFLARYQTKEAHLRDLLPDPGSSEWCILTQESTILWGVNIFSSVSERVDKLPNGVVDLLALGYGAGPYDVLMLFKRDDGSLQARYRGSPARIAWSVPFAPVLVLSALPVRRAGSSMEFVVAGLKGSATEIRCLSAGNGRVVWKTESPGSRCNLAAAPDLDGDGIGEVIAWGEGAAIFSGATGALLQEILPPARRTLAVAVGSAAPHAAVSATPEILSSRELPGGRLLWEKPVPAGPWHTACPLPLSGAPDLIGVSDGGMRRIDGKSGEVVWTRDDVTPAAGSPLLIVDLDLDGVPDILCRPRANQLACLSGRTGATFWTYDLDAKLAAAHLVALSTIESSGSIYKLAAAFGSGDVVVLDPSPSAPLRIVTSPITLRRKSIEPWIEPDGRVSRLIALSETSLSLLSMEGGDPSWSTPFLQRNSADLMPVHSGATVVVREFVDRGLALRGYGIEKGELKWEKRFPGILSDSKALVNGAGELRLFLLRIKDEDHQLSCVHPGTGEILWTLELGAAFCWLVPSGDGREEVGLLYSERDFDLLHPGLNGRLRVLSSRDGKDLRTCPVHLRNVPRMEDRQAMLVDLAGDGSSDLLLVDDHLVQRVESKTGRVVWARVFPSLFPGELFVRGTGGEKDLLLAGNFWTCCLRAADGTQRWNASGTLRSFDRDRWLLSWGDGTNPALEKYSWIDVDSGRRKDQAFAFRPFINDHIRVLPRGEDFLAFQRTNEELRLIPLQFRPAGDDVMRRSVPGSVQEFVMLPRKDPGYPSEYPDTPEGAATGFLNGLRHNDADLLRRYGTLESVEGWPERDLLEILSPRARADLIQWLFLRREQFTYGRFYGIDPTGTKLKGTEADVTLSASADVFGSSLRARRTDGAWRIVVALGAEQVKQLFGPPPREEQLDRYAGTLLKVLCSAEADFRFNDRDGDGIHAYWTGDVAGLYFQKGVKLIERESALADSAPLEWPGMVAGAPPVPRFGYLLRAIRLDPQGRPYALDLNRDGREGENTTRFAFCAYPAIYSDSVRATYVVDQINTIWKKDLGGKPVERFPADPAAEGWKRVD